MRFVLLQFEDAAKEALAVSIAATEVDEEIPSIQIILEAPTLPRTDIRSIAVSYTAVQLP